MQEQYDIVVAGGGPSGLQFAREVADRSDHSVAVLEANGALSDNDKSTGGTFHQVVEGYGVPDEVVMDTTRAVVLESPDATAELPAGGYVLDFPAFLEFLGEDAERKGATVHTGVRVTGPVTENGRVTGVRYRTTGSGTAAGSGDGTADGGDRTERELSASVVVDATGPRRVLTEPLGMFEGRGSERAVGKEYVVEADHDVDSMVFSLDHDDAPGGYAWTFPAGEGLYKAGVCWFDDAHERHATDPDRTIDDYVRRWIDGDDRWDDGPVREVHAGDAWVNNSMNRRATDGLVAVGDAVASINPILGEGIRPGMESAEMAAEVVVDAIDAGDTSRERLAAYERRWNDEKGSYWRVHRIVGELLYDFDAAQQNRFVRKADRASERTIERFQRYELGLRDLLDLYPFKLKDIRKAPAVVRHL